MAPIPGNILWAEFIRHIAYMDVGTWDSSGTKSRLVPHPAGSVTVQINFPVDLLFRQTNAIEKSIGGINSALQINLKSNSGTCTCHRLVVNQGHYCRVMVYSVFTPTPSGESLQNLSSSSSQVVVRTFI